MSRTFTNSLALLDQIKSQVDNPKEYPTRDQKITEHKSYGSIKRSYIPSTTVNTTQFTHHPNKNYRHN